jgi:hypothetical protein
MSSEDKAFQEELAARQKKAEPGPRKSAKKSGKASTSDPTDTDSPKTETAEAPVVPSTESGDSLESAGDNQTPGLDAADGTNEQAGDEPSEVAPQPTPVAVPVPSTDVVEVVAHPADSQAAFRAMDRYDEVQIIEEIEGRMSEVLVYKIPTGTDLSFAGVREAIRLLVEQTGRRINTGTHPPIKDIVDINGEPHHQVMVYAVDESSGQGYWGTAQQPVQMKLRDDTARKYREKGKKISEDNKVDDEFAFTKALSKAQRNALKYFIPEQIRQGILAIAQKNPAKLREITMGPGAPQIDAPAALNDEKATALINECKERYTALKREYPAFAKRLPPGKFNSDLRSAWSSHAALETLRDNLVEARTAIEAKAA